VIDSPVLPGMFGRVRNSKPGCTASAAVCPDLLPPGLLHPSLTDDLGLVSGGCWTASPSRVAAPRHIPTVSKSVHKQHMSWEEVDERWRFPRQHVDGRFGQSTTSARDHPKTCSSRATASSDGAALYPSSNSVSERTSYTSLSSDPYSHSRSDRTSPGTLDDLFTTYMNAECDERHLEEHSGVTAEQSRMSGNKASLCTRVACGLQPSLRPRETGLLDRVKFNNKEHGTHGTTKRSDRRLHYPAPSNTSTFAHISTDTLPTIASSAVLGPALMPKIARDKTARVNKLGDVTSTTSLTSSVEVDEIVGGQYQNHEKRVRKDVLRDTWNKARSRLGRRSHRASR
jgi:hypothetical protein